MAARDKYFGTTKRGEVYELKQELDNPKEDRKKDAVKKVIAAMTVGKDVSSLFTDVVKCMNTANLELKKLVYLYIMNYAKTNPDLAILAVNSFVQDAQHPNPLIRALAVRTMGCIRVNRITEYLCEPLRKTLKDQDPYVRKTAAVCVAKLHDIDPELVADQGFLDMLRDLLSDSNPMVVANAVAALTEIEESSRAEIFQINAHNLNKLLAALNECTEWGQIFIMNSLSNYHPSSSREAETICERITPRLQHANSAVVLAAVKVLIKYMSVIDSAEAQKSLCKKMGPPLVTLLSKEPEIQYVALRNINLIIQKQPSILQYEIKVFFIKYNDPIYVKMEKLEVMILLVSERNVEQVLLEFKEYATEVDVEFVRRAVRAIGRCAVKLEKAAERCISVLLELIQTKVNYVVQEAIIVIKDVFRKFPNRYESIIATLCENLDTLDEPEAKASMIWIIGEYAERIVNADELLGAFLETFKEESAAVQLQLLTATVKLFLKRPKDTQSLVQLALNMATQEVDDPDLRDRGFVYWRLLSTDPEAAKAVVLAEKPLISEESSALDASLLDDLINNLSTLASVYHKPPETFVTRHRAGAARKPKALARAAGQPDAFSGGNTGAAAVAAAPVVGDLLGGGLVASSASAASVAPGAGGAAGGPGSALARTPNTVLLPASAGNGLQIAGGFIRRDGLVFLDMAFQNQSPAPLNGFAIQFNVNTFCLAPAAMLDVGTVNPGETKRFALPIALNGPPSQAGVTTAVQMAIKNNVGIFYFTPSVAMWTLFTEEGALAKADYLQLWSAIPDENERVREVTALTVTDPAGLQAKLAAFNVFTVAKRNVGGNDILYLSIRLTNDTVHLLECTVLAGTKNAKLAVKTQALDVVPLVQDAIEMILKM